jgi:hypothetical protein
MPDNLDSPGPVAAESSRRGALQTTAALGAATAAGVLASLRPSPVQAQQGLEVAINPPPAPSGATIAMRIGGVGADLASVTVPVIGLRISLARASESAPDAQGFVVVRDRPDPATAVVTKEVDGNTSVLLTGVLASGQQVSPELFYYRSGRPYLRLLLSNASVTRIDHVQGKAAGSQEDIRDPRHLEDVTIAFRAMEITDFQNQKHKSIFST